MNSRTQRWIAGLGEAPKRFCHLRFGKIGGILLKFVSLQTITQALQVLTALLVIRHMAKEHYAWYTIAFGLQGSLSLLSQIGVGVGIHALGGQRIGNRTAFGEVIAAAKRQRLVLLGFTLPVCLPVYYMLLAKAGAPFAINLVMLGLIVVMLLLEISAQMASSPFALAGRYNVTQVYFAAAQTTRFALIGTLLLLGLFHPICVLLAGIAATAAMVFGYLFPKTNEYFVPEVAVSKEVTKKFFRFFANGLPNALNAIFQAQIAVLLIGIFGNASSVADLGALTRLALLLAVPQAIIDTIFRPRLAAEKSAQNLKRLWTLVTLFGLSVGLIFFLGVVFFRGYIVMILGEQYETLVEPIVMYAAYLGFIIASSSCLLVINSRGWLRHTWVGPFVIIAAQALTMPFVDLSTIEGVIIVRLVGDLAGFTQGLVFLRRGFQGKGDL